MPRQKKCRHRADGEECLLTFPFIGLVREARYMLQTLSVKDTILNLEQGHVTRDWGRIIFYVGEVDKFWAYLKEKGFNPDRPRDAEWGERYFHLHDPDGQELSFAQPVA